MPAFSTALIYKFQSPVEFKVSKPKITVLVDSASERPRYITTVEQDEQITDQQTIHHRRSAQSVFSVTKPVSDKHRNND